MKRSRFIYALLAAVPLTSYAKAKTVADRDSKGFLVKAGEGRFHGHIRLKGVNVNILDIKISGKDTNGDLAIFEQTGLSPKRGTPLHIHHAQDEIFYVMEGAYRFQVDTALYDLKQGDSIFLPRKVPHAWTQVSDTAKMTVTVQPAGRLEEFFVTMAAFEQEPTKEQVAQAFADHGMEVVGPTLNVD